MYPTLDVNTNGRRTANNHRTGEGAKYLAGIGRGIRMMDDPNYHRRHREEHRQERKEYFRRRRVPPESSYSPQHPLPA